MCGLAGIISLNNNIDINADSIYKMGTVIAHRGPDSAGYLFGGNNLAKEKYEYLKSKYPNDVDYIYEAHQQNCVLIHRRLSIIDISTAAAQPMIDTTNRLYIIFNGEIYNHKDLRKELEQEGYNFATEHSDTEVILNSYLKWGANCLEKLRGMFSFVIWDKQENTFFIARDRVGVKPFYYAKSNGYFCFGSEIKSILQLPFIKREVNEKGFYNYLTFLSVPAPETMFKDIFKIPAGHYMIIKNNEVSEPIQYWDVFDNVELTNQNEEEIKKQLIEELKVSVKLRTEADVPVGVFLSGGIDSSLNTALFTETSSEPVKSFSVGYEDDHKLTSYKNEFEYSRLIAKKLNSDYKEKEITQKEFIDFLSKLVYYQDEPIADPVCVPVYFVSKLARDNNVTVCQVGEGSDELFWGYLSWKQQLLLHKLNAIPFLTPFKKMALKGLEVLGKDNTVYYEWLRKGVTDEKQLFWAGSIALGEHDKNKIIHKKIKDKFKNYSSWESIKSHYHKFKKVAPEQSQLNWMTYIDLKHRLPELLLMRVDKMSMAVSLEARVPFLDHKFIEYSMGIPTRLKTKNNESKYILKKAVEGILPNEIIYRKKQGFGAPVFDWFFEDLGEVAKKEIFEFNEKFEYFDKDAVKNLFETKQGKKVWYILNFVLWHKEYIQKEVA